jgi:hypothetical protein
MALLDSQIILARTFEVQAAAQQAIYQAEIAQKALAQRLRREAEAAENQVETMEESDPAQAAGLTRPWDRLRSRNYRGGGAGKKNSLEVSGTKPARALPAAGHVDITV